MKNNTYFMAKIALFVTAIIWGSTFVVVKGATDTMSTNFIMATRFTIGSLVLAIMCRKKFKLIDKEYIIGSIIMGTSLWGAYAIQVVGLGLDTTPGKSAFLTAIYCVLVPFLYWITFKDKPDKFNFLAAVLCIVGIGMVSLNERFSISLGDLFTIIGGVLSAVNIVAVAYFCKGKDEFLLTFLQLSVVAIISWIGTVVTNSFPVEYNRSAMYGIVYLGVFATAVCLLLQSIGLKYTSTSSASIILSLESVFGVIFSILIYHETITLKLFLGFFLIFIAVIISETKLSFLFKKSSKENLKQIAE